MARVLARKEDRQLLGGTEFEVRERVHRLGAQVVESVLRERKKRLLRGECRVSALRGKSPLRERAGQGAGEFAGAGAVRARLLSLRGVWTGRLSVGWRVGSDGGDVESRGSGSGL